MRSGSTVLDRTPPDAGAGGGGGGWAWLLTARGHIEAQLVRGVLESNGIVPVALDSTDPSPGSWMFLAGNINALVRVYVPRSLLDAARLALLETGVTAPEPEAPPEPSPGGWRANAWWIAVTVLAVAVYVVAAFRTVLFGS